MVSAGFIYGACEYFVNGVEWVGRKIGVSQNAVGTVLAAFGTALPESVVTFVAVVFGKDDTAKSIGVGAALGGPLVLATIAYPVVGLMLWITRPDARRQAIDVNVQRLGRDQSWFLLIFRAKVQPHAYTRTHKHTWTTYIHARTIHIHTHAHTYRILRQHKEVFG